MGISIEANTIIKTFLSERLQSVIVNRKFSDWIEIKRVVPQGTVLGQFLFNLYIIDIQKRISHECYSVQYADNRMIIASCLTSNNALNPLKIPRSNSLRFCRKSVKNDCIKIRFCTFLSKK